MDILLFEILVTPLYKLSFRMVFKISPEQESIISGQKMEMIR